MLENGLEKLETRKRQIKGSFKRIPIYDLEDAINVAKFVSDNGAGKLDADSLAEVMGYSNTTIRHHINSAKHHDIIISFNNTIELTDVGRAIANPTSNEEFEDYKIKAFLSCDLYNRIYLKYKGMNLPNPELLGNIFARDEGVSFKTKERTVQNFIKSGVLVGLIEKINGLYHCVEFFSKKSIIEENESDEFPKTEVTNDSAKIEVINESAKTDVKNTQSSDKIKISTEPFFELYIKSDEAAFEALIQLLPHYKKIYCKKDDDSL